MTTTTTLQSSPREALLGLLERDAIPLADLASLLDGLPPDERVFAVRSIPGKLQAKLFEAAKASAPLTLEDYVPADRGALAPVRHFGRNSLPAFKLFEKRFCRAPGDEGKTRLWGYNHQPLAWLTGPGCYVAYMGAEGELWIDYRETPTGAPTGWPAPRANTRGIGRLVYGNMVDRMRRVSRHVTIGRAFRPSEPENNWFVLCREA
jgi:hypothetical protein